MSELESKHYLANGGETLPQAREALEWAAETRVSMADLKFCDLLGTWQHMPLPLRALDAGAFEDGLGFDGSSIRGWPLAARPRLRLRLRPRRGSRRVGAAGAGLALRGARRPRGRPRVPAPRRRLTEDLNRTWIDWKREHEVDVVRLRPHPAEFSLYYDC